MAEPPQRVEEEILERGHLGIFAADALYGTAFAFGRLLTLVTKHFRPPPMVVFDRDFRIQYQREGGPARTKVMAGDDICHTMAATLIEQNPALSGIIVETRRF